MTDLANEHLDNPTPPASSTTPVLVAVSTATSGSSSRAVAPNASLNAFDPHCPLPDNERNPLYLAAPQTWAERNPTVSVQPQRLRAKLTDAAKATKKIAAIRNKAKAELLTADIETFMALKWTQIQKIAWDHNRQVSDIEKLVNISTHYRKTRAPSLSNALTHMKTMELNEGISYHAIFKNKSNYFLHRQRSR